jgi:hypothetical protein
VAKRRRGGIPHVQKGRPRSWPAGPPTGSNIAKKHSRRPGKDAQEVRPSTAAWSNARLPTRAELIEETLHEGAAAANADYQSGDVTPVTEPGRPADEIHHLVGNVQV